MIKITTTKEGITYEHPTGVKQTLLLSELKAMRDEILNKEKEDVASIDSYITQIEAKALL